jgi:tetratricopeptide (TPR) repeat protein
MVHLRSGCWIVLVGLVVIAHANSSLAQPAPAPATSRESRFSRQPEQEITFQQGLLHYSRGQLAQAEAEFRSIIQADPTDAEAYYHLGLALLDQGKPGEALPNFDQSIQLDPTAREVRAARASANIRVGHYDAAEADLAELKDDPAWQSYVHYSRGQIHYNKGELDDAAKEFQIAKQLGGEEATPAGFYEGLTYLRMRELVQARRTFRESSLNVDRDPTVAAASRQLDAVLTAQQQRAKPYEVQLTLGYEYDSNAIQLGSNVRNPEGISNKSDWRAVVQPRGSYTFFRNGKLELGLEGSGYFSWQNELSDFDTESYQGGPFMNYRINDTLFASMRYGYNLIRVGHENFLERHILTPQLTLVEPKFGYTSAYYQFQTRDFDEDTSGLTAAQAKALDRDGINNTIGIVQGINLPPLFKGAGPANLDLSYRFENQQTDGSDFDGNFNQVAAVLYTPLPIEKFRADVGVNFGYDQYSHRNSLDVGGLTSGDKRRDMIFGVVVGITREITQGCAVRVDYSYTNQNSNLEFVDGSKPYDYDRHQVGIRLILSY